MSPFLHFRTQGILIILFLNIGSVTKISAYEIMILHCGPAKKWAAGLVSILQSSKSWPKSENLYFERYLIQYAKRSYND